MRKLRKGRTRAGFVALAWVVVLLLLSVPLGNGWAWRTHGAVYGSRGIAPTALNRIMDDPGVPQGIKESLNKDWIRIGSCRPDTWRRSPYYIDTRHVMTYCENEGAEWLLGAEEARVAEDWDNVSYYLGIACHYWADLLQYAHHDNARSYFENLYGSDVGYRVWDSYHDHLDMQVKFYRPKDPALIVSEGTGPGGPENRPVDAVDPNDTTGAALSDAQTDDGVTYDVSKDETMHFDSIDTSGVGTPTAVVLWVEFSVEAGYNGDNPIEWSTDESNFFSTGIVPTDGDTDRVESYDLYTAGVDTLAELEALDIRFINNDPAPPPDPVYFDYVWVEVAWAGAAAGEPYPSLEDFLSDAESNLYDFIDRVMPPDDPLGGWFGDWIETRKCESNDYSEYAGNPGSDVAYGAKELVDMATELVYSGWVYALGIQNDVTADTIAWDEWWDRSHREPGIWAIGF
jgi:hypothetical protein